MGICYVKEKISMNLVKRPSFKRMWHNRNGWELGILMGLKLVELI